MNVVNFESNRTQAGVGALLLLLSIVPYAGWVLGLVGIVLLVKSMREFANYYGDQSIYQNTWTGIRSNPRRAKGRLKWRLGSHRYL